ncbi:MAG: RsmD family RNA methyltransferase [Patescibacteria group bacterium]
MIRITSGIAKGKKLQLPNNKRVTAVKEVVKLAIFSIIGDKMENATCLDLFSGSGNLGIEALSRGASFCDFIDESKYSIETIEKNLKNCGLTDRANPIWDDVLKFLANVESKYDIIFADPYYTETNHRHLIKLAMERLNPNGLFFLLSSAGIASIELPKELIDSVQVETRKYGKTLLTIITH